jgi:DNA-binding transcriptional LysR family regulator
VLTNNYRVETRRLRLLVALDRLGSMREVAEEMGLTTSTVSQQLAILARDVGAALVEPDGRRVRLTPAGRRLAAHGVTILGAVEAAELDLSPTSSPAGSVKVAGFASAVRRALLPLQRGLPPGVRLSIREHEPAEAFALLDADDVDLAMIYDYNLAPLSFAARYQTRALWTMPWSLGAPAGTSLSSAWSADWIVNSRNTADEDVARTLAALNGGSVRVAHRCDSLNLVVDLIEAGLGVALLPADMTVPPSLTLLPLSSPSVLLRAYAVTRRGRDGWPPLALVLSLLQ